MEQLAIRGVTRNADASMVPVFRAQTAKRAAALVERTEAFLESRVAPARQETESSQAASEVMLGSFVFSSVSPMHEPEPRWQRGLAARLKQTGAVRSATAK